MTFPLSQALAMQGMTAPVTPAESNISGFPVGGGPLGPGETGPGRVGGALAVDAATGGGLQPRDMLALMQAFGGLKAPAPPGMLPAPNTPSPVAPQGANPTAIANTGNTGAIASLLAAGIQPQQLSALGQLVMGGR